MTLTVLRFLRRVVIAVVGVSVILVGVAMIVLPGPAVLVIPAGLGILATEFVWAKRLLKRMRKEAAAMTDRVRGRTSGRVPAQQPVSAPSDS